MVEGTLLFRQSERNCLRHFEVSDGFYLTCDALHIDATATMKRDRKEDPSFCVHTQSMCRCE
jgi:hypothetical protein